jgi:PAS domain-containing protein
MPHRNQVYREVGLPLGIGQWLVDLQRMQLYWPRGMASGVSTIEYTWASFDEVVERHFSDSRGKFMGYIEDLVRHPGEDRTLSIQARNLKGDLTPLRVSGRSVRDHGDAFIYGLLCAGQHGLELEDQAHTLSLVLDAAFFAVDAGMVVFDHMLTVRRANRKALAALGVTALDRPQQAVFEELEERTPPEIRARLIEAIRQRATVSGIYHTPLTRIVYRWRATPYGKSEEGARGVVVVFERAEAPPRETNETATARHAVLQHVHVPVMVLQPGTGEIAFANPAARAAFKLQSNGKNFVRNLVDLCGRAVPQEAYDEVRRGGQFVNLRLGARVAKLEGPPEELLVEYLNA